MKTLTAKDLDDTMNGTGGKSKFSIKDAAKLVSDKINEESDDENDSLHS